MKNNFQVAPGDRPLLGQICGNDPKTMLAAAQMLEPNVDGVDVNLGCPQIIARRGNYGAFLLEKTQLLVDIVSTMVDGLEVPVTCKIRLLEAGLDATIDLAIALQSAGCSILTVHGRTRKNLGDKIGDANWDAIRQIKEAVDIPVFANGSIEVFDDVQACIDATGVDGVMVSEAILERPDFFANIPYSVKNQDRLTEEYLDICKDYPPLRMKPVRNHVFKFLHTTLSSRPELRPELGKSKTIDDVRAVFERVKELHAEHEYECTLDPEECPEIHATTTLWYRRHRNPKTGQALSKDEREKAKANPDRRARKAAAKAARRAAKKASKAARAAKHRAANAGPAHHQEVSPQEVSPQEGPHQEGGDVPHQEGGDVPHQEGGGDQEDPQPTKE